MLAPPAHYQQYNEGSRPRIRPTASDHAQAGRYHPRQGSATRPDPSGELGCERPHAGQAFPLITGGQQPLDERRAHDDAVGEAGYLGCLPAVAHAEPDGHRKLGRLPDPATRPAAWLSTASLVPVMPMSEAA